ncbi:hypothetical protein H1R20_g3695, partial [Candolleomyces eurysporus]
MSSPTPLIFKRSGKAKSQQRARQTSLEPESNDNDSTAFETAEESPSTLAAKLKTKVKKSRTKSKLSFGAAEEEEGDREVFQIKKSKLSTKLALGKNAASVPLDLDQATISPSRGPTYDQAYLNELKSSTPSARPANVDPYDADMSMDVDSGDISTRTIDVFQEDATTGETLIPSESSVKVAKEKRERLRKMKVSGEEDFISLSVTKRSEDTGPHPESRLVREEDELGEGDDEYAEYTSAQERIALGKNEEVDEETMEWEQEQLRRGGHRAYDASPASKPKQIYKPAPIPAPSSIPTLQPAMTRLSQQLALLTTSHANNTAALNSLAQERLDVDEKEKEMRDMVIKAEDKRAWFGDFRDWLESVAGFLDEKYPMLEKLEDEHVSLLQERLQLVTQRREADDQDDLEAFFGPLPIVNDPNTGNEEETDELGRVIPKPSPAALQKERRTARQGRHQKRVQRKPPSPPDEEGYSTDSSLPPSDASDYASAISSLSQRTKAILADVRAEEFRNPTGAKWNAWREKYGDSYRNAWGGLGVVSAWEFWVRLELVGWDCIQDVRSLDSFRWYASLYEYSRPAGNQEDGDEEPELGPDGDLVASMISTAIIPRLCKVVEGGALDVYSEKHVKRMVDLAEEVEATMEEGNIKFQNLLGAVFSRFRVAVEETETLLHKFDEVRSRPAPFHPEAIPSRRRFLFRRVKLLKNLWRWRKYTGERFGIDQLISRHIEHCFVSVAEGGWDIGGKEAGQTVASIIPRELVPLSLKQLLNL